MLKKKRSGGGCTRPEMLLLSRGFWRRKLPRAVTRGNLPSPVIRENCGDIVMARDRRRIVLSHHPLIFIGTLGDFPARRIHFDEDFRATNRSTAGRTLSMSEYLGAEWQDFSGQSDCPVLAICPCIWELEINETIPPTANA